MEMKCIGYMLIYYLTKSLAACVYDSTHQSRWGDATGHPRTCPCPFRDPWLLCFPFPKVYKLLYASRLADHGLPAQALQYCEHICTALLRRDPAMHPALARQLLRVSLHLCIPPVHHTLLGWEQPLRVCCQVPVLPQGF